MATRQILFPAADRGVSPTRLVRQEEFLMLEDRDDEYQRIYDEPVKPKVLDSETLRAPMSVLARHKPYCAAAESPIGAAIQLMQEKHIGAVLVVDGLNKLVGIFTERDVIQKVVGRRLDLDALPVSE